MPKFLNVGICAAIWLMLAEPKAARHFDWLPGGTYTHISVSFLEVSESTDPVITAPGESLPGAAVCGATTVTPGPSAAAHAGVELDGDGAALAVEPPAADEPELLEEQPVSATRAAVPHASTTAPARARAIPLLLIM
jgi:hypothetical protein